MQATDRRSEPESMTAQSQPPANRWPLAALTIVGCLAVGAIAGYGLRLHTHSRRAAKPDPVAVAAVPLPSPAASAIVVATPPPSPDAAAAAPAVPDVAAASPMPLSQAPASPQSIADRSDSSASSDRPAVALPAPAQYDPALGPILHPFQVIATPSGQEVTLHGMPILAISTKCGGMTPEQRADTIAFRLNDILRNDIAHDNAPVTNLRDASEGGLPIVFFGYYKPDDQSSEGDVILTMDPKTAKSCGVKNPRQLACWWRDVIRDWLLIGLGDKPRFTNAYSPVVLDFYTYLKQQSANPPAPDDYKRAHAWMLDNNIDEYNSLATLYRHVPAGFVASPSTIADPKVDNDADKG